MKILICSAITALALPVMAGTAYAQGCSSVYVGATDYDQSRPLTLDAAIARAANASPEVLTAALEAKASSADADQASRWLNPSLSVETENFAGSGSLEGFNAYETTLVVAQTLQLGDKRRLSERAARAEAALASAECSVRSLEAQKLAGELYLELRAAYDMAEVAQASADLASEFSGVVQRRVDAGASAPPELLRARAEAAALQAVADGS